jgi:hypothetical protein
MGKKKTSVKGQTELFNIREQLNTAACVPQIREAIKAWRAEKYKSTTNTTRELFNFWFHTDHILPNGQTFRYHTAQREAIEPQLVSASRLLSTTPPFPTSKKLLEAKKTVFNYTACGNDFEYDFAKFLDKAEDVSSFAKIPDPFGFCIQYTDTLANIRNYYPDFIAVAADGTKWIVETKGREDIEVKLKDNAALNWCRAATGLTKEKWRYLKVPQQEFEQLHPETFGELIAGIHPPMLSD